MTRLHVILAVGAAFLAAPAFAQSGPGLCTPSLAEIDASVAKTLAQGSPGMAVAVGKGGRVLLSRGYGFADLEHRAPVTRDTVFSLASITKQFTAAAVLLLAEEGKLKLDEPVSKYVPELPQGRRVTLYQLLVQTSGIPDYAEDPAGSSTKSVAKTPAEMLAWISRLSPPLQFEPGSKWAYSNSNYALLGLIAERVSGEPLSAFFQRRLFTPAGLRNTAFDDPADVVPHRARGYRKDAMAPSGFANADWISPTIPGPAGGLRSTAGDLLRWSDALHSGRILKASSLRRLTRAGLLADGRTTKFGMPEAWQKGLNSDYAMGFFLTPTAYGRRLSHGGDVDGFSTWLAHYPERQVTIALLINSQSADMDKDRIEAAVFRSLEGRCTSG
jgi:CubicO group peptidase (beta-lactamase class C family)